ncbi:MAG: IS4 family transposase [SAR324 cluster bacterium]|nr:IS4 family transposase [SAR324 cluster bacterium]
MSELSPLINIFKEQVDWHQARITFLANFIIALIRVRTVNLTEIATAFNGRSKVSSHYRRLQRFFKNYDVDFTLIAKLIVSLLPLDERWILCMDRTNWKFGDFNINILVLAIAYKGAAVPVFWVFLEKRGNSNTHERMGIMYRFIQTFGKERIDCLTADREFIGKEWIEYLQKEKIPFRIRIRNNTKVPNSRGNQKIKVSSVFRGLEIGESMILNKKRLVWGSSLHLIGLRLKDEWLVLITDHAPQSALNDYGKRWEIESLFACLKTRGFNFEDTHLKDTERISKMLALMTIAFCWCYRIGEWDHQQKQIPIKKHGRLAKSLFRNGLDLLRNIVINLTSKYSDFIWATRFLSCT